MTRNQFDTAATYAARLADVVTRPTENSSDRGIVLLRLEFEVFETMHGKVLRSFRRYACRELIVGKLVEGHRDANILAYAQALRLPTSSVDNATQWSLLKNNRPWITVKFGAVSLVDYRQPFADISHFDPTGWKIEEFGCEPSTDRVSVEEAAAFLCQSPSTIRRKVDDLAHRYGETLLTFTDGGHRRINLEYLRLLLDV